MGTVFTRPQQDAAQKGQIRKMLFNSLAFAAALPVVFCIYWICPARYRWIVLLAVSYLFCASFHIFYALVLLATTAVSYFMGRRIERAKDHRAKKAAVAVGILILAAELSFFKYTTFLLEEFNVLAAHFSWNLQAPTLKILLPVGISFYVFQTISYLADVYKGRIPAEKHFGYYALYVSFFPSMICGPIGRAGDLLPQYRQTHVFNPEGAAYGIKLMAWGYFKKIVIADTLAVTVNQVYGSLESYTGLILLIVAFMYSIEIYCDFSGYSDIAIGLANLFGIRLKMNFDSPYYAHSIREFWGRWHISLSTWLRDYIYIPLGGSRRGTARRIANLMITFVISGVWHGANWTFLIWGILHGLYQAAEILMGKAMTLLKKGRDAADKDRTQKNVMERPLPVRVLQVTVTFLLITAAWVFFRADSMEEVCYIFSHMFRGIDEPWNYLKTAVISLNMDYTEMVWIFLPVILLTIGDVLSLKKDMVRETGSWKPWVKYPLYMAFVLLLLVCSEKGVATEFIYSSF